jgi:hypothetical protein
MFKFTEYLILEKQEKPEQKYQVSVVSEETDKPKNELEPSNSWGGKQFHADHEISQ